MSSEIKRIFPHETRADDTEGKKVLTGTAAVFNKETIIGDKRWGWREIIVPGAFSKTITEYDQRALWNHESKMPLARRSAGTLVLTESETGLDFEIHLGNQSYAHDAFESVQRRDVQGMSFGFEILREEWEEDSESDELPLRKILETRTIEISPVTFPAYEDTTVEAEIRATLTDAVARGVLKNKDLREAVVNHQDTTSAPEPRGTTWHEDATPDPTGNHLEPNSTPDPTEIHPDAGPKRRNSLLKLKIRLAEATHGPG